MCEITRTLDKPIVVTGYKVAVKENGKYYSPATGVMYETGRVPKCPELTKDLLKRLKKRNNYFRFLYIIPINGNFHNSKFNGNTALFKSRDTADRLKRDMQRLNVNCEIVVLMMNMSCTMQGIYYGEVYIGNVILSIEEV